MSAIDACACYLAGADDDERAAALEERLFIEPELARAAAWLLALQDALKELAAQGPVLPVVTHAELASLASHHAIVQCVPAANTVDVTLPPDVAFVAVRVPASLGDARWIDVEFCAPNGTAYFRVHEAPYDPDSGEIVVLCQRHVALAAGDIRVIVRDHAGISRGQCSLFARAA